MNNHNHRFNKHNLLLVTLIIFSLATGYIFGSQTFNKSLYDQKTLSPIAAPSPTSVNPKVISSPNITGVPAKTQNQINTE